MKVSVLMVAFWILIVAGNSFAQETKELEKFEREFYEHQWSSVETATSGLFRDELDRNFYMSPSGNVQYWVKRTVNGFENVGLYEVDCVKREQRELRSTRTDRQGNQVASKIIPGSWLGIDNESSNSQVANMVCQSIKPSIVTRKVLSRKPKVKGSRKRP